MKVATKRVKKYQSRLTTNKFYRLKELLNRVSQNELFLTEEDFKTLEKMGTKGVYDDGSIST